MAAPVLQAMLLADQVYQDRGTGKYVICGIFSAIHFVPKEPPKDKDRSAGAGAADGGSDGGEADETSESSPSAPAPVPIARLVRAGSPFAYVSLTELQGTRKFELRYVDLEENNVLFGTTFEVSCRDPLETIQITVPLPPLPIPHEGVFVLELLCDGEMLGSHRVLAKSQPKG
jgi:hypothetical protein